MIVLGGENPFDMQYSPTTSSIVLVRSFGMLNNISIIETININIINLNRLSDL